MNIHLFLCGPGLLFENRSINAFGIKTHIGIKFHTVYHAAVLCVVDNKIQADPLDRIFHAADLDGAGQVSSGSSTRSLIREYGTPSASVPRQLNSSSLRSSVTLSGSMTA